MESIFEPFDIKFLRYGDKVLARIYHGNDMSHYMEIDLGSKDVTPEEVKEKISNAIIKKLFL